MNAELVLKLLNQLEQAVGAETQVVAAVETLEKLAENETFNAVIDFNEYRWQIEQFRALVHEVSLHKRSLQFELNQAFGIPVQPSADDIPF